MNELRQASIRVTSQRETVLDILKSSPIPLNINQIKEGFPEGFMDQSTLYRILDLFVSKNLITKTVLIDPMQSVYGYKHKQHRHLLICINCQTINVISGCPLHGYEEQVAQESGYVIMDHQLELYGLCPTCQQGASYESSK